MKKPRQFLPLLGRMLGFYRFGPPLPLLLWLAGETAVLFFASTFLLPIWMQELARRDFLGEQIGSSAAALWLFLMLVSSPLPFHLLRGLSSLEFLFTRAVDRGLWLRAERTAVIIIALGPLLLNLALSPWQPRLTLDPADSGSTAAMMQERYHNIFPGGQWTTDASGHPQQFVIPHGPGIVAAWLVWSGAVLIFLVAGYFTIVFQAWQRAGWHHSTSKWRPWLGGIMIQAPAVLPLVIVVVCALLGHINLFERCFLLYARHPAPMWTGLAVLVLVVQTVSERNIRKLEFEFF